MAWPLSQDYNEAIQDAAACFTDPDLRRGVAVTNALGLPVPCSGNFADVYALQSGPRKWAVKCFTRQIPGLQERYVQISKYLQQVALPFMVEFAFLEKGIRIRNDWYPILKMQWVEGFNLNVIVRDNLDQPAILQALCQIWLRLAARLREANLAHGDLQHGNVLLVPGSKAGMLDIKLVDYDGMCVPALEMLKTIEVGHPAYQHPQRLRDRSYGPEIDRFSHLVIYTALRALAVGGKALWSKFDSGDNLLFGPKDFEAPAQAPVFQELRKLRDAEVQKFVQVLSQAAQQPLARTPHLCDLVPSQTAVTPQRKSSVVVDRKPPVTQPTAEGLFAAATAGGARPAPVRPSPRPSGKRYLAWTAGCFSVLLMGACGLAGAFVASSLTGSKETGTGAKLVAQVDPTTARNATATVRTEPKVSPKTQPKEEPKVAPNVEADPEPKVPEPKTKIPEPEPKTKVPEPKVPEPKTQDPPPVVEAKQPKAITNSINMKLVLIPAGRVTLGSPDNEKGRVAGEEQRNVEISQPFYMGIYEVTQGQYEKVMGKNPSIFSRNGSGRAAVGSKDTNQFPVENVSWEEAQEFCRKLSQRAAEVKQGRAYRLPTEAEWEYACRAGTTTPFHFGNSLADKQANIGETLGRTTTVGSYPPNAFGLYDMHGNVSEWCKDLYNPFRNRPGFDEDMQRDMPGLRIGSKRMVRGGSWFDPVWYVRSACRTKVEPDHREKTIGFRVISEAAAEAVANQGLDKPGAKTPLQGTWQVLGHTALGNALGKMLSEEAKAGDFPDLVVKDNKLVMTFGARQLDLGVFKIDDTQNPPRIDITTPATGPFKGAVFPGIYTIEGDTLKICLGEMVRPTNFNLIRTGMIHITLMKP